AFMEYVRFRRVDVLGLVITQCATTESNRFASGVPDREHDPVAKQVPGLAVLVGNGFGFQQRRFQILRRCVVKGSAGAWCETNLVSLDNGVVQTALLQVVPGIGALLAGQCRMIKFSGEIECIGQGAGLLHFLLGRYVVGHFHASAPGDRKSTRLNSSHVKISYAVFCLKKKKKKKSHTVYKTR